MGLFEHRHDWLSIRINKISAHTDDKPCIGEMITQSCRCGVIRTITIQEGLAPVVRYAKYDLLPSA